MYNIRKKIRAEPVNAQGEPSRAPRSLQDFRMTPPGVCGRCNRIAGTPCDIPRAGALSVHVSPFMGARQIRDPVATLPKTIAALPGGRTLLATTTGTP
jgi:hypothetical protein